MSKADYKADSHNHAEILICIKTDGNFQENELTEAILKIKKHSKLVIADAGRTVHFRFEVCSMILVFNVNLVLLLILSIRQWLFCCQWHFTLKRYFAVSFCDQSILKY